MKLLKLLGALVAVGVIVLGVGAYYYSGKLSPDVAVGTPAPDVTLTSLEGQPIALSSMSDKVVLLDFWGSH